MQEENIKKAFQNLSFSPKDDLSFSILSKILKKEKRIRRIKLVGHSLLGFLSIVGFFPVFKSLFSELAKSGFYEYFSLAFSSGSNITFYWKELMLSLAESLPVVNILFSLILVFVFLLSIRYMLKQIISINHMGRSYV
ncbi:MAG: hypothetical protein WCX46_01410 [Candidatus Paceibacterota bacterium]